MRLLLLHTQTDNGETRPQWVNPAAIALLSVSYNGGTCIELSTGRALYVVEPPGVIAGYLTEGEDVVNVGGRE